MDSQKLFLLSFLLILHFIFSFSLDTITINQTFEDGDLLTSQGNKFALGFFSPGNSKYKYLGIWYHNIPEQTVVWVANRNKPINGASGVLSIDQYGNLILRSNQNQKVPVWHTNITVEVTETCVAQLLDSGNLILIQGRSKRVVWQSFNQPTDTLLPGMRLGLNKKKGIYWFLTSWRSADDPGIGNFSLQVNTVGVPQFLLYRGTEYYWRITETLKVSEEVWNLSSVYNQDEIYASYNTVDASVIFRVVLDHSGTVKTLAWHEKVKKWKEFWSAPSSLCDKYGHCGTYGICYPDFSGRFECDCLPGYEPKSHKDWNIIRDASGGCVRKRLESSSVCGHGEGFVKVAHVKLPDTSTAVLGSTNVSPIDCEKECRRNCSCVAYAIMKETGCLTWYGELMDTVDNLKAGYDIHIRVDALELEIAQESNGFPVSKDMLAVLVVCVVSAWFVIIILFAYLWLKKKRRRVRNQWSERLLDAIGDAYYKDVLVKNEVEGSMNQLDIAFFNLSTILVATNNFSQANKLGEGGFGLVYKGQLFNGQEIAVKRLSKNSCQGIEEFKNEVILIAKLQHKNLVKLLGCCVQGDEAMLVYEYLPNKSLNSFIFDATKSAILDWRKRFDIIVGIARGILYIHQDSRLSIIHRDLKTSNILLDAEMNPKISDFGLARIFKGDQIQEKTKRIVGTFGYMSPEYSVFGKFSAKSDVFSFGVILLEIITGKKNNSYCQEDSFLTLIGHVWHLWRENRALEIIDSSLRESCPSDEVLRCIQIGLLCVQEDVMERPMMSTVVLMLNSDITLPFPKQPAFIFSDSSDSSSYLARKKSCYSVDDKTITEVVCR
uniref:Receptor-like serine/threonine-protein kinase n=4 Tax=Manihot esculenta TaxID=3983 RepID=A0A199UAZ0_MANES